MTSWNAGFLRTEPPPLQRALVILNQSFSPGLLRRLWNACQWRCCADGGANRLFDVFNGPEFVNSEESRSLYIPDFIKGDLDSIRGDVRAYYASHGVEILPLDDQDSTDLMKCVEEVKKRESENPPLRHDIILLGGLSGRLDQTVHTLSYLHKLHLTRPRVFAVSDDNVAWVLGAGEHRIHIDHDFMGQTCGLLPVGIDSTMLTTSGLRWNLENTASSFDGMVSTSNHLVPEEQEVRIHTTKPIWWSAELKRFGWD